MRTGGRHTGDEVSEYHKYTLWDVEAGSLIAYDTDPDITRGLVEMYLDDATNTAPEWLELGRVVDGAILPTLRGVELVEWARNSPTPTGHGARGRGLVCSTEIAVQSQSSKTPED